MNARSLMPTPTQPRSDLEPLTGRLLKLPLDPRGYPVPWFVAWLPGPDGPRPDFRVIDTPKFKIAIQQRRCWVCGEPLGKWLAFPIGPMCAITRTTSEPPCHLECATWSVKNCPFLANPQRTRDDANLPPDHVEAAGAGLRRNPGVVCLWLTRTFDVFRVHAHGNPGVLVTIGDPMKVSWFREGRAATRAEVQDSIDGGFPALLAIARTEGPFAIEALGQEYKRAARLWNELP